MGYVSYYDLNYFIKTYKIKNFIETGTLYGEGVEYAQKYDFDKIVSIEIEDDLAEQARVKFSEDDRVNIITGDSAEKIEEAISIVGGPCIYWLDAHFPGGDRNDEHRKGYMETTSVESRVPLLKEIQTISESPYFSESVLLIDDARLFEENNPNLNNHLRSIGQPDVTRDLLCPYTTKDLVDILLETHKIVRVDATGEGNYIAVPHDSNVE